MCKVKDGFILCSCGRQVKRPSLLIWLSGFGIFRKIIQPRQDESDQKFRWHLFQRANHQLLDGEVIIDPAFWKKQKEIADGYRFVEDALNARTDCFDFRYEPEQNDVLRIQLENTNEFEFIFSGGLWYLNDRFDPLESWDLWLLNKGIIKDS